MDNHINWTDVQGHWNDYKDRVQDKWKKLTDDDFASIRGDRHRLMEALQDRYGMAKEKVEEQVSEFFQKASGWLETAKDKVVDAAARSKDYVMDHSVNDMAHDFQQMIATHPVRSVLVGAGIGYILGRLMSRR